MATTTNTQQLHDEFTTHFKLVCWIIRRRLGMLGRYDDEHFLLELFGAGPEARLVGPEQGHERKPA